MKLTILTCLALSIMLTAKVHAAENLLIISIDGLRWQEVFQGIDPRIVELQSSELQQGLNKDFSADTEALKRQKLMPFLWQELVKKGLIIGNRTLGSKMNVSNDMWFSYPGYNELLTGKPDPKIISNDNVPNTNITFLEWLNKQRGYQNKVATFGSWDVFSAIINQHRSGVMVNAGFESAVWPNLSTKAQWLNILQQQVPSPWHNVRFDAFTAGFASEYINTHQPKVIYIALGETDDYAHQDNYAEYIRGAHRDDQFIALLWQQLQSIKSYHNNTNLIITVDHGRGNTAQTWQHHSSDKAMKKNATVDAKLQGIIGSDQIWLAAMGPDLQSLGEVSDADQYYLSQVAATALNLLGFSPSDYATDIGNTIHIMQPLP
jgi:hypothetical protein